MLIHCSLLLPLLIIFATIRELVADVMWPLAFGAKGWSYSLTFDISNYLAMLLQLLRSHCVMSNYARDTNYSVMSKDAINKLL